jgi:hypothetical protein
MLFDLRGRGRRRAVKVIYIGLAVLIGAGLVLFGVGSIGGSGGVLNGLSNNGGSSSASFAAQIKKYRKLTQTQPNNLDAWQKLTSAQLHEAGGEAYVSNGQLTSQGRELFSQAARSWNSYLALNPSKPNTELAAQMVRVFGQEGLNEPAEAVHVLQIVVAARPTSASLYALLAQYAYQAKNPRVGDLAAAKAISLAPAAERARLKIQLAAIKKNPSGESTAATASGTASTGASGAAKSFTATSTTSTPPPSGQTSSTKK